MAYAAITCLMSNIQQSMQLTQLDLQSFYGKFNSLRGILEKPRKSASYHDEALLSLEARIAELADAAGYEADSLSRKVFMAVTTGTRSKSFHKLCCFLNQAVEGIDSTMKQWLEILDRYSNIEAQNLALVTTPELSVEAMDVMVGHENKFEMMLNQLTTGARELQVVSIVGMGGSGKTTLANKIYIDPSILSRFDIRAKVVVSQEYSVRSLLVGLLSSIQGKSDEFTGEEDGQLADRLQKLLKSGRRYLIFIDDIWTTGAWDDIKLCFADCSCGSRILLTTRNMEVAEYASSGMPPYQLPLLTFDESWSLLYEKVFVNDCFPPKFEQIGKQIALNCGGLPLAVVVIAGLLAKAGKALDEWESIAENVTSSVSRDLEGQCMRVVGLSYHHLPHHLKACFLYLAIYPEDELIFVDTLIKLWSAEGFMKVDATVKSTEVAELCLKDLIDRNLIFIHQLSFDGRIKTCRMHDVIHELCLREARSINSVNVINESQSPREQSKQKHQGRISIQSKRSTFASAQLATGCYNECRSILLFVQVSTFISKMPKFVFSDKLRVLDLASVKLDGFPSSIVNLFHLRYLNARVDLSKRDVSIPPSIANLLYLQTLILEGARFPTSRFSRLRLPSEIFKMSQLRHLSLYYSSLDHQYHEFGEGRWILRNLETLSGWNPKFSTSFVFRLFPNVKKLRIGHSAFIHKGKKCLDDLFYLDKLEELEVRGVIDLVFPPLDSFPKNLKKLTFVQTRVRWEDLRIVGKLPKLEALKLFGNNYDSIWEVVGEGFPSLKFLQLCNCSRFKYWKASSDQFPCLERLFVKGCRALESIPQDFAEVTTLKLIDIRLCSESLANSAKQIQQESEDNYERSVEVIMW